MIDTHCHLHSSEFDSNREELLNQISQQNIKAILVGTSIDDSIKAINLASHYDNLYSTVGVHPHEYENINISELTTDMESILTQNQVVAIGECGFDFYYHQSDDKVKQKQEDLFRLHIDLAIKYSKTLIIHTRDSFEDTYRVLAEYKNLAVVLHCFTGDSSWVHKFNTLPHTIYFSFSGIITFKNSESIQEAVKVVPENRLLVETDAPYLSPVPYRGKQNTPLFLEYNIHKIAELRSSNIIELTDKLDQNAKIAFNL